MFLLPMVTSRGSSMYDFAIFATPLGIVAENNHVLFSLGVWAKIPSMSSLKPILSISSASSKTVYSTLFSFTIFLLIMSISLPGVATTI